MITLLISTAILILSIALAYGLTFAATDASRRKRYLALAVLALMGLGGILRLWLLGHMSFWVDEAISTLAARGYLATGQPLLPSGLAYNRAIPHVIIIAKFLSWFGDSERAARLPSILFGGLSIGLVYFIGRALRRPIEGLIASGIMAFNMWFIVLSREARMYAMFQFLIILAVLFFIYAYLDEPLGKRKYLIIRLASGVLAATSFYLAYQTQKLALTILPGLAAFFIIMALLAVFQRGPSSGRRWLNKHTVLALSSLAIAAVAYVVIGPEKINAALPQAPGHLAKFDYLFYFRHLLLDFPVISVLAFIGAMSLFGSRREGNILLLSLFIVPMIGMSFIAEKLPRYIYHLMPFLLILAGCGVMFLWDKAKALGWVQSRLKINLQARNIILVCSCALVFIYALSERNEISDMVNNHRGTKNAAHSNWEKAAAFIGADTKGRRIVLIPTDPTTAAYYFGDIGYYLFEQVLPGKTKDIYTNALQLSDQRKLDAVIAENDRGYVIIDTSHWNDYMSDGLKQHIMAKLQYEPEGSDNTIWVFSWSR